MPLGTANLRAVKLFSSNRRKRQDASADEPVTNQIVELTEVNRRSPDPALERSLLRLRHDAFADLPKGNPGPIPDPDPEAIGWVDGLPSVAPGGLTPEALRAGIDVGGCLLVRGLVDEARIGGLVAGIDRAFAARDAGEANARDGWFEPLAVGGGAYNLERQRQWVSSAGGVWTADSPRMTIDLIDLFESIGLLDVIGAYLGERPVASVNKWTLRRVSPGGDADWHQDGAFLGEDIRAMNVWVALTDCGRDAPGMDVVPRRLDGIVETGTDGARFDWSVSPQAVEELLDGERPLRPEFQAGDILLFDGLFLHQTANEAEMTKDRYAVETWCFGPSSFPDKQVPLVL
jgi:Phytanoyl-CoA dioxygenase (PhyH)